MATIVWVVAAGAEDELVTAEALSDRGVGIVQCELYFHVMPAYYFIRYKAKDKESLKTNHKFKTKLWLSQQHLNLDYQIYVKKVKLRVNLIDLKRCTLFLPA